MADKSYMMFEVDNQAAKMLSCTPTKVTKGDKATVNTYVWLEMTMLNTVLAHFHPELRHALYGKTETKDIDADHLPRAKFPQMGSIKWAWVGAGYGLQFHVGGSGHNDIRADVETLDRFSFEAMEGGTVKIKCRAKTAPGDAERGRMTGWVGQSVTISLSPPDADSVPLEDAKKGGKKEKPPAVDPNQTALAH